MKEQKLIKSLFSSLNIKDSKLKSEILKFAIIENISKNSQIIKKDQFIKWFIIVLRGRIRVWHQYNDRELTLYTIKDCETCVYSIVAIEKNYQSLFNANTLNDTVILKIPIRYMQRWKKFKSWEKFTVNTLINKYDSLLKFVELIAFKKIDERILKYLKDEFIRSNSRIIDASHSQIAKEIGTTRVVVSKTLKELEKKGVLTLQFKKIKLLKK